MNALTRPCVLPLLLSWLGAAPVCASAPAKWEDAHNIRSEMAYGPERQIPGADTGLSGGVRYEPTLIYHYPQREWSERLFFSRFWISWQHDHDIEPDDRSHPGATETTDWNLEWREFYWQENRIFGDPEWAFSAGRQRYAHPRGYWWDTSLESLRLSWNDGWHQGFFALGQRLNHFSVRLPTLDANARDIALFLGHLSRQWRPDQFLSFNMLYEHDYSGVDPSRSDPSDARLVRLGLAAHGILRHDHDIDQAYRLEAVILSGRQYQERVTGRTSSSRDGWLLIVDSEIQDRSRPWHPQLHVRAATTDKPAAPGDGYGFNAIQSDRMHTNDGRTDYLFSRFTRLTGENFWLASFGFGMVPRERHHLTLKVSALGRRSRTANAPLRITGDIRWRDRSHLAATEIEAGYAVDLFPIRWHDRQKHTRMEFHLGYLIPGPALQGADPQMQAAARLDISF